MAGLNRELDEADSRFKKLSWDEQLVNIGSALS
jgi:hypothetical protein